MRSGQRTLQGTARGRFSERRPWKIGWRESLYLIYVCIYNDLMGGFELEIQNVADHCAATHLRTLTRFVSGVFDEQLRPLDLKISQLNILVLLATLKEARPVQLCEQLCLDPSTLSRNLDRMRARNWLEMSVAPEDARAHVVRLTEEGKELLRKALPFWKRAQERVEATIGKAALEAIRIAPRSSAE